MEQSGCTRKFCGNQGGYKNYIFWVRLDVRGDKALQSIKSVEETLGLEPFADKWSSFGWVVGKTCQSNL